ncbi:hypothetical protein B5V03_34730 [Bradyrhizobium betae]|uniref:Uncharacterized protein n=1 Tax=Bradyrhizobium betae TaxID=244734 RepID=A0A4V1P428_9BRAD|nr:hypothetical protein B5V03_34730 [Bradyrhizobium betae]
MGIERMHSAKYWRMRAEEFRTKADCCEFSQTRDTLQSSEPTSNSRKSASGDTVIPTSMPRTSAN